MPIGVPCGCCELCRWCWCGGDKLPGTLTAVVGVSGTWTYTFCTSTVGDPGAVLSAADGTVVTLTPFAPLLGPGGCGYRGTATVTGVPVKLSCGSGFYICWDDGAPVFNTCPPFLLTGYTADVRVLVSAWPCDYVTSRGRKLAAAGGPRYEVDVRVSAVRDPYGNLFVCGFGAFNYVEGLRQENVTLSAVPSTGSQSCGGGHVAFSGSDTITSATCYDPGMSMTLTLDVTD